MGRPDVTLPDGARVSIRPIAPDDRDALRAAFDRLSPESRYRRFFSFVQELSERDLDYLTQVDHRDHEALVALDGATGDLVGVARYVRTGEGEAEPAIVVADDWQGRKLGSLLIEALATRAREEGVTRFRAPVLADNAAAINVLTRLGDNQAHRVGPEVDVEVALTPAPAARPRLLSLLRAAAEGTIVPGITLLERLAPRARAEPPARHAVRDAIVVGMDPTQPATATVRGAAQLALALGCCLELVGARRPLVDDPEDVDLALRTTARELRERGLEVTVHVRRKDPAASLVEVAVEQRARFVVVGPPQRNAVGQLLPGDISETVVRYAPCAVLILR